MRFPRLTKNHKKMGLRSWRRWCNRRSGQRGKEGNQQPRQTRVKGYIRLKGSVLSKSGLSGFDEQEGAGILRQIHELHSVGRMQLAKGVEGTAVFLRIPHSPYWQGEATEGTPVNDEVWVYQKSAKRKGCFHPLAFIFFNLKFEIMLKLHGNSLILYYLHN